MVSNERITRVTLELDCGNCPMQKDEELDLKNRLFDLIFQWKRGIEIKSMQVEIF